jgi:50S ribosomal subunit-associated GTPase HflX
MNKVDLLLPKQRESLRDDEHTVHVSAAKGIGLTTLLDRIDALLEEDRPTRVRLLIPQGQGKALSQLEARARIYSRKYRDGLVELEADAPDSLLRRMKQWVIAK